MTTGTVTHVITGGAGFIGVNLAKVLLARGDRVLAIDDLSRGKKAFVDELEPRDFISFRQADVSSASDLDAALVDVGDGPVEVWHLCANSDIPAGVHDPGVDLKDTFLVTHSLLAAMRRRGWAHLHFASTSAVYGDHGVRQLSEETFCQPISNYGAMKLASEAAIYAAAEFFLKRVDVFRFPNVVGVPATHGVILDFVNKLQRTPGRLDVLGNGTQRKAYLHVSDLVAAMLWIADRQGNGVHLYNIGPPDEGVTVKDIAELTCDRASPGAIASYGIEDRGWVGDVPRFSYDVGKLARSGWLPSLTSREAIILAIDEIVSQEHGGTVARGDAGAVACDRP